MGEEKQRHSVPQLDDAYGNSCCGDAKPALGAPLRGEDEKG